MVRKTLTLIAVLISLPMFAVAKQQLVVVKHEAQFRALEIFSDQNQAKLTFQGNLSLGDLYLLESDTDYQPVDLFIADEDSQVLVSENSVIQIGPALISSIPTLPMGFVPNPNQDLSHWQWGLDNDGNNTPDKEDGSKPPPSIVGYDAQVLEAWKHLKPPKKTVVVAVIDSGLDVTHPEIKDHLWINQKEANGKPGVDDDGNGFIDDIHGYSFVDNSTSLQDAHGHGTHCSGVIVADHENKVGIKGIAPGAKILTVKIFGPSGTGSTEAAIKAIDYAVKMKVDVISASWGGGLPSDILKASIANAMKKNILFVAGAGNDGADNDLKPFYPASYDLENIISVAAHHNGGQLASFSNFGVKKVHLSAPGQNILSTLPNNRYAVWSGTSMATPHVTAAIALLLQQEGNLPMKEIKDRLIQSSLPQISWRKKIVSMGRLNVLGLLENAKIPRGLPLESNWKTYAPQRPLFETSHPMKQNELSLVKDFQVPGAKFVRLVFGKTDFLSGANVSVNIRDPRTKTEFEQAPLRTEQSYRTDFLDGDSIGFRLYSVPGSWGLRLEAIEYQ